MIRIGPFERPEFFFVAWVPTDFKLYVMIPKIVRYTLGKQALLPHYHALKGLPDKGCAIKEICKYDNILGGKCCKCC